jgi:hypothetical protein
MSNIKLYLENNSNYNLKEHESQAYGAPYVRPCALDKFLDQHDVGYSRVEFEDTDHSTWYPINIYFFDFACDYFNYIRDEVLDRVRQKRLRILFIYSEPDDPFEIEKRLQELCQQHSIDRELIFFLSGNSVANSIDGMAYLQYHEYLFEIQNTSIPAPTIFDCKTKKYTCLNRVHKQYRKEFVYNIWKDGLTKDAYVSYGNVKNKDQFKDQSILNWWFIRGQTYKDDIIRGIDYPSKKFEDSLPLSADNLNTDEHNDHSLSVDYLFTDSYWNIVMETYMDATGGVFLTEKTFKPIKYGQPFVILGTPGSLELLSEQGYKTFSPWVDESYDQEKNVRYRWYAIIEIVRKIADMSLEDLHKKHIEMTSTILHNQAWFKRNKKQELEQVFKRLP